MTYMLIPRIRVAGANAHAAAWVVNSAPVMAINMLAHNIGVKTGYMPEAVGIIHHTQQMLLERSKWRFLFQQRRAATFIDKDDYCSTAGKSPSLSLQPTASCNLTISLVLAFKDDFKGPSVKEFVSVARIAGGQVLGFDENRARVFQSLDEIGENIPAGYWIIERNDLLSCAQNPLETMMECIFALEQQERTNHKVAGKEDPREAKEPDKDQASPVLKRSYKHPWLVPTVMGYAALTEFALRENGRCVDSGDACRHAFAEPLVGLAQYVPTRSIKTVPFWRHKWLSDDVFIVTQSHD